MGPETQRGEKEEKKGVRGGRETGDISSDAPHKEEKTRSGFRHKRSGTKSSMTDRDGRSLFNGGEGRRQLEEMEKEK